MTVEDSLAFGHGDMITHASVLRRRGGPYIAAYFVIKRKATGRSDFFICGAGPLRSKVGVSEATAKAMMADFKSLDMPVGASWEDVAIPVGVSILNQFKAIKQAGVPLRYEVSEK